MENGIRLNFKDEEMILRNKSNCLYDFNHQYYKVKDANLIVVIVMGVTEAINYLKMKKMDNDCKTVNRMGSDKGLYIGILIILIKYSWHNMKQNYTLMGGKAWCCFSVFILESVGKPLD